MSSFHPTRREILLVICLTVVLGLFLQFDLSLRFTDASGSDSLLGFKVGFGRGGRNGEDWDDGRGGRGGKGDKWLSDVEAGVAFAKGKEVVSMAESKVKWGDQGAVRTEVLGHAPGEHLGSSLLSIAIPQPGCLVVSLDRILLFLGLNYPATRANDQAGRFLTRCTCTTEHGSSSRTSHRQCLS